MASEDPKAEGLASRPARTPPTLDLKAEEVVTAPAPQAEAAPAGEPSQMVEAPPPEVPGESPAGEAGETGEKSAEQVAEEAIAEPAPAAAPVAAPARSGAGAVVAALIAGAIGGGAVAGGLWYAAPMLAGGGTSVATAPAPPPAPPVDLSPLTSRLAALEARPVADPQALAALGARLDRSEAALKGLDAAVAALKSAPAPAPVAGPSPAPAVPSALVKSVEDLKAGADATREALAAAKRDVDALRTAQASLQTSLQAAVAAAGAGAQRAEAQVQVQAQALAARIDAIGPRLDGLKTQIDAAAAASTAFNRAAAGMVVLGTLRDAVLSGRPFAAELAAARAALGPAATALDPFAGAAAQGYAPPAKLAARLAEDGAKALGDAAPPAAPAPETLVNRLLASAESLVKVRPATGPGAVDSEAVLGRAVAQVRAGQLEEALGTLKGLPQPVAAQLAPVTAEIEARIAAVKVASALYQQSLAAISGKVP